MLSVPAVWVRQELMSSGSISFAMGQGGFDEFLGDAVRQWLVWRIESLFSKGDRLLILPYEVKAVPAHKHVKPTLEPLPS